MIYRLPLFRLSFIITLLVTIAALPATASGRWHSFFAEQFVSTEFKVAVSFPAAYEQDITDETSDKNVPYKVLKVSSASSDNFYMLSVTKHPTRLDDTNFELTHASMESFVDAVKGEIKSQKVYSQKGSDGKEALIYIPDEKKYVHYRVIIFDTFHYQLLVLDENENLSEEANAFMNSFKIQ